MRQTLLFLFFLLLAACTSTPKDVQQVDELPPIYPDYCDVTIPVNIAPLNFLLRGDIEAIEVSLTSHLTPDSSLLSPDSSLPAAHSALQHPDPCRLVAEE